MKNYSRDVTNLKYETLNSWKFDLSKQKINEMFIEFISESKTKGLLDELITLISQNKVVPESPEALQKDFPVIHTLKSNKKIAPPVKSLLRKKHHSDFMSRTIIPNRNTNRFLHELAPKYSLIPNRTVSSRTVNLKNSKNIPDLEFIIMTNLYNEDFNKKEENLMILFNHSKILSNVKFDDFLTGILDIPVFFRVLIPKDKQKLPVNLFLKFWKDEFSSKNKLQICFDLLAGFGKTNKEYLVRENFTKLVKEIVEEHPDYEVIKDDENFKKKFGFLKSNNSNRIYFLRNGP